MLDYDSDPENEEENDGCKYAHSLLVSLTNSTQGGASLYNDGKGIKLFLIFTPLLAHPTNGKRPRSNAKPPTITKINHFHEDYGFRDLLVKLVNVLERDDLLNGSWLYHGSELDNGDSFSLAYTIPRRVTVQVRITCEEDFVQMRDEATKKIAAEVKFYIVENKVHLIPSLSSNAPLCLPGTPQKHGDDEPSDDSDHEENTRSKKKVSSYMHHDINLPSTPS